MTTYRTNTGTTIEADNDLVRVFAPNGGCLMGYQIGPAEEPADHAYRLALLLTRSNNGETFDRIDAR